jgi:hypothetical protein
METPKLPLGPKKVIFQPRHPIPPRQRLTTNPPQSKPKPPPKPLPSPSPHFKIKNKSTLLPSRDLKSIQKLTEPLSTSIIMSKTPHKPSIPTKDPKPSIDHNLASQTPLEPTHTTHQYYILTLLKFVETLNYMLKLKI